jgi:hypothetical protein
VVLSLATQATINLLAEVPDLRVAWEPFSQPLPLARLLDLVCTVRGTGRGQGEADLFWRRTGTTYLVRSLGWPEEELARTADQR